METMQRVFRIGGLAQRVAVRSSDVDSFILEVDPDNRFARVEPGVGSQAARDLIVIGAGPGGPVGQSPSTLSSTS